MALPRTRLPLVARRVTAPAIRLGLSASRYSRFHTQSNLETTEAFHAQLQDQNASVLLQSLKSSPRIPQTLTEKIVQKYAVGLPEGKLVQAGDYVSIQPHRVMTHDNSWPVATKFLGLQATKIHDPGQAVMALDHDIQNKSESNLRKYRLIEEFAKAQGVDFYPAGRGIGHQIMVEEGHAWPGTLCVASDSHSNHYGGVGCLGTAVVRTDAASIWATGKTWWQIPPIAKVTFTGRLPDGVSSKDVIVALCGLFSKDEVLNHAIEFTGSEETMRTIPIDGRLTIANMTTEWTALSGLFPIDEQLRSWLRARASAAAVLQRDLKAFPDNFAPIFFKNQFRTHIEIPTKEQYPNAQDTTVVITGSNTGLGLAAAKQLLSVGVAVLIMAVRSLEKGEAAATQLRNEYKNANIQVWELEMGSYESINRFMSRIGSLPRVDVIILNAGISPLRYSTDTETKHEMAMQINHFSTALLALTVIPVLKRQQTTPRLVVVNSVTAHLCKFPNRDQKPLLSSFDDTTITPWDPQERYGVSKLISQLFIIRLAEMVSSSDVIIGLVDPGLTKGTGLARDVKGILALVVRGFLGIAGRTVDQGAATYVNAAFGHDRSIHGCFLMNNHVAPLSKWYYTGGQALSDRVWNETLLDLRTANTSVDFAFN